MVLEKIGLCQNDKGESRRKHGLSTRSILTPQNSSKQTWVSSMGHSKEEEMGKEERKILN
jgi:hypothetical protein